MSLDMGLPSRFIAALWRLHWSNAVCRWGRKLRFQVSFRGENVGVFRCDLMIERKIILELKIADQISKAYEAQLLHYLKASPIEVGLILSFGESPKFRRMEFRNDRKRAGIGSVLIPS